MQPPLPPAPDLHTRSGLDVVIHRAAAGGVELRFGPEVLIGEIVPRRAADLDAVLRCPAANGEDVLYTLYRNIAPREMAEPIARRGLLYVAMILRAGTVGAETVGEEWVRTRGHVNSPAPGTPISFPEVHEVWTGQALLYLQKEAAPEVSDVVAIAMNPGDKAVVPPGWASLLVNTGDAPLVVGSWRTADCVAQSEALAALGGMAHFVLAGDAPGAFHFEPNPGYRSVAVPRRAAVCEFPDWGLHTGEPMLTTFHRNPDFFRFLTRPQDYQSAWASLYRE